MNIIKQIPSYLLGLVFVVFGLNYFFHFIPQPPPPAGDVATYTGVLFSTKYLLVVKVLEIAIGILLLIKPTRALALLLIAPIVVNILLFELLIAHKPDIGVVLMLLTAFAIYQHREKYWGIIK
jgi:putative oxidoreductase